MAWVLIILYFSGGSPSVAMHDFNDQRSCEAAVTRVQGLQSEMKGIGVTLDLSRRRLFAGALGLIAAPAIVRVASLMAVRPIVIAPRVVIDLSPGAINYGPRIVFASSKMWMNDDECGSERVTAKGVETIINGVVSFRPHAPGTVFSPAIPYSAIDAEMKRRGWV